MSSQDFSRVVTGQALTVPASVGSNLLGPFVLYRLAQGEIARVEAVTFTAVIAQVLTEPVSFVLQLRDPTNNVLWQYLAPPFIEAT